MTDSLLLAHLSDLHLSPLDGFSMRHWNLKRGLGYLNWHRGRKTVHRVEVLQRLIADLKTHEPDHVAVTGDLVNLGLPAEYQTAARWLGEIGPPDRVTVVPGNHDIYVRTRRADGGLDAWSSYMSGDHLEPSSSKQPLPATLEAHAFPFVRRVGPAAIVGLCSAVPTPPFVAAGRLGRAQLDRLGPLLDTLRLDGLLRVILIHHPPLPGQAPPRRALQDAADFAAILDAHGAELIVHGHNHRDTAIWRPTRHGAVLVAGIASASAGRTRHGESLARYNLFRISGSPGKATIAFHARGLIEAGGAVADLDRRLLTPE